MRTWTATATAEAHPEAVLHVLTDPDAASRWAPVPFDVEDDRRLAAGRRARVSGRLAGRRVGFDVEVHAADVNGLALTATGPVGFDVDYRLAPHDRRLRGPRIDLRAAATRPRRPPPRRGHRRPAQRGRPPARPLAPDARGRSLRLTTPKEGSMTALAYAPFDLPSTDTVAVSATALTRTYGEGGSAVHALRGVSIEVPAGQFTAVMGPSGSGKSTLMHLLAGLDTPDAGAVHIAGEDITRMSDRELTRLRRKHIGFVFQSFNLLPTLSAEENVLLPLAIAGRKPEPHVVDALLERMGLAERRDHKPAQLSGGQQQRVAVARALICKPTVLFADEPTGNLDSASGAERARPAAHRRRRGRPDDRHGHARRARRGHRRPRAVPRRRPRRGRPRQPDRGRRSSARCATRPRHDPRSH